MAVQGGSLDEVRKLLNESLATYFHDAMAEAPATAHRLLNRRAPLAVRIGLAVGFFIHSLRREGEDYRAGFDLPCPA